MSTHFSTSVKICWLVETMANEFWVVDDDRFWEVIFHVLGGLVLMLVHRVKAWVFPCPPLKKPKNVRVRFAAFSRGFLGGMPSWAIWATSLAWMAPQKRRRFEHRRDTNTQPPESSGQLRQSQTDLFYFYVLKWGVLLWCIIFCSGSIMNIWWMVVIWGTLLCRHSYTNKFCCSWLQVAPPETPNLSTYQLHKQAMSRSPISLQELLCEIYDVRNGLSVAACSLWKYAYTHIRI